MLKKRHYFVILLALFLGGTTLLSFSKSPSFISTFQKPQTETISSLSSDAFNHDPFGLRDENAMHRKGGITTQDETPYFFSQKMEVHKRYRAPTSTSEELETFEQPQTTPPPIAELLKTPTPEEKKDVCEGLSQTSPYSPFRDALKDLNCPSPSLRNASPLSFVTQSHPLLPSSPIKGEENKEKDPHMEEPISTHSEELEKNIMILLANCNDGSEPETFENSPYKLNIGYFKTEEAAYIVLYAPDKTLLVYKITDKNFLGKTSTFIDIATIPFEKVSDQNTTTQCLLHSLSFNIKGEPVNMKAL